ncbi:hypothetical protein ACFWAY_45260 [Rhodococcus sp. NPDC059968]|uniref:hypothetical protein n=1 Tax=Rhodococcus sp. NPDC059968 TaxID=3347017 RepID=UPI00366ECE26
MMKRHDKELADFALRWLPFGGPTEEDILVNFGITKEQFHFRILRMVDVYPESELGRALLRRLQAKAAVEANARFEQVQ